MRDTLLDPTPQAGDVINNPDSPFHGATVIAVYTRAEAIEDGVLVDLTPYARAIGISLPVAITNTAFYEAAGRLYPNERVPILTKMHFLNWLCGALRYAPHDANQFTADFIRIDSSGPLILKIHIGGGNDGEAVLTIMLPNED